MYYTCLFVLKVTDNCRLSLNLSDLMRFVGGISRAYITSFRVLVVAVAVIARMHPTLSLLRSKDALSLIYEGRKLCDLLKTLKIGLNHEIHKMKNDPARRQLIERLARGFIKRRGLWNQKVTIHRKEKNQMATTQRDLQQLTIQKHNELHPPQEVI